MYVPDMRVEGDINGAVTPAFAIFPGLGDL